MKISIAQVSSALAALVSIITIVGFVFQAKEEIVDEVRQVRAEVAKTRATLITEMQWVADDIEYETKQIIEKGEIVPRYLVERKRRINELLEDLKSNEKDTD